MWGMFVTASRSFLFRLRRPRVCFRPGADLRPKSPRRLLAGRKRTGRRRVAAFIYTAIRTTRQPCSRAQMHGRGSSVGNWRKSVTMDEPPLVTRFYTSCSTNRHDLRTARGCLALAAQALVYLSRKRRTTVLTAYAVIGYYLVVALTRRRLGLTADPIRQSRRKFLSARNFRGPPLRPSSHNTAIPPCDA